MVRPISKISIMGCGWLGLPLARALRQSGYQVHGSTTRSDKLDLLRRQGVSAHLIRVGQELEGDLDGFFNTDLLFLNIPPGRGRPDVADRFPEQIQLVLNRALADGTRRLIFISSTSVYPDVNRMVTETDPIASDGGSGLALIRSENFLRTIEGLPLTILRPGGLAGGNRKPGRFLAGRRGLDNGGAPVNMIHLDDCVAIIQQLIAGDVFGETFNLVADAHPTRAEFYRQQALQEGLEPPVFSDLEARSYKLVSNDKLRKTLGYSFQYPDPMNF